MDETQNYEALEAEVRKIDYNLFEAKTPMTTAQRLTLLNVLRYDLGLIEDRDKVKKVVYNGISKKLEYSRSVEIGVAISIAINDEIRACESLEEQQNLYKVMQETYYYLARYLFEYFLPAMEFGIPPEKQFIAPRTCVLNRVAREMSKFYYREDRPIMTLSMPQGTGKEQPLSSKILTPTGWITMEDVKVGTKVIGADGKACNVTGVYPKGVKDVYRVTFDDNTYVDCGLEHLWEVKTANDRRYKRNPRIVNTKQMIEDYILGKESRKQYYNYSVRLVQPIEFCYGLKLSETDIKPYTLGTLIANGSLTTGTLSFATKEQEVVEKVKQELPSYLSLISLKGRYCYEIKNAEVERDNLGHFKANRYIEKLREYGLFGKKSETKFIPKNYLYADIQNRIELLKGLIDGDGHITDKGCCTYHTVSEQLKDDVLELIRGLGGKASFCKKKAGYRNNKGVWIKCKDVYQINFILNIPPSAIESKTRRYKKPTYNFQKKVTKIEKVRQEECQCIMVDHPEHLYVTDGYTLTHNTEVSKRFLAWSLGNNPDSPSMFVSYSAAIAKDKRIYRNRCTNS